MKHRSYILALLLVASACSVDADTTSTTTERTRSADPTTLGTVVASAGQNSGTDGDRVAAEVILDPIDQESLPNGLSFLTLDWTTDWGRRTVDLSSIFVGINTPDPRDRIAPLDNPSYSSVAESQWLAENEPGVLLVLGDEVKFYPLSIMTRHEIVNDTVDGVPVSVIYCPLCNTGLVFDRRLEGETLRLGVSGLLRRSDMVMWDDLTDSLWQQITGAGIVGEHAGDQLTILPSRIVSFGLFSREFPEGLALSEDQAFGFSYGLNPYVQYSSSTAPIPSFFQDKLDLRLPALSRVVGVDEGGQVKGYAFGALSESRAVNDVVGGVPIVIFWGDEATSDALDVRSISSGAGIGTASAYLSTVGEQVLTFEALDDLTFRDIETGSTWSIFGNALDGPLVGEMLGLALHRNEFFFAWAAFFPDAELWGVDS
jgi:hypothetical protein